MDLARKLLAGVLLVLLGCTAPRVCSPTPADGLEALFERAAAEAHGALSLAIPLGPYEVVPSSKASLAAALIRSYSTTILYNRPAMVAHYEQHGYAAVVAIFAHEFGHVLDAHQGACKVATATCTSAPVQCCELSADEWAGCALAYLGLPVDEAARAWAAMVADAEHPPGPERAQALLAAHAACL